MVGPDLDEPLLSVNEVARLLGISRSKVYALMRDGCLRPYRVGRRARFARADVRRYLERQLERGAAW
jgi:putative molybdopterin biosynthesis protein